MKANILEAVYSHWVWVKRVISTGGPSQSFRNLNWRFKFIFPSSADRSVRVRALRSIRPIRLQFTANCFHFILKFRKQWTWILQVKEMSGRCQFVRLKNLQITFVVAVLDL